MRYLIILLFAILTISTQLNAQNTIQNFTDNNSITEMVSDGLNRLDINNSTITILPLKDYYKSVKRSSNGKPWGATVSAGTKSFTMIISLRHEADIGISFSERIAHELIHIKQGFDGRQGSEKEAYNRQAELARAIN